MDVTKQNCWHVKYPDALYGDTSFVNSLNFNQTWEIRRGYLSHQSEKYPLRLMNDKKKMNDINDFYFESKSKSIASFMVESEAKEEEEEDDNDDDDDGNKNNSLNKNHTSNKSVHVDVDNNSNDNSEKRINTVSGEEITCLSSNLNITSSSSSLPSVQCTEGININTKHLQNHYPHFVSKKKMVSAYSEYVDYLMLCKHKLSKNLRSIDKLLIMSNEIINQCSPNSQTQIDNKKDENEKIKSKKGSHLKKKKQIKQKTEKTKLNELNNNNNNNIMCKEGTEAEEVYLLQSEHKSNNIIESIIQDIVHDDIVDNKEEKFESEDADYENITSPIKMVVVPRKKKKPEPCIKCLPIQLPCNLYCTYQKVKMTFCLHWADDLKDCPPRSNTRNKSCFFIELIKSSSDKLDCIKGKIFSSFTKAVNTACEKIKGRKATYGPSMLALKLPMASPLHVHENIDIDINCIKEENNPSILISISDLNTILDKKHEEDPSVPRMCIFANPKGENVDMVEKRNTLFDTCQKNKNISKIKSSSSATTTTTTTNSNSNSNSLPLLSAFAENSKYKSKVGFYLELNEFVNKRQLGIM